MAHVAATTVTSTNRPETRAAVPAARYTIGSGDILNIQVWKEKDLSQVVTVRPDGKISLPLLNELSVAGLEPSQLEAMIHARLLSIVVEPQVTVTVAEIHSRMVYIAGEVARPGAYPLNAPITVLQLIAQAGGITAFASRKKIHIIPADSSTSKVWLNYKALTQGTDVNRNLALNPGDTVVVP
ncbi:polysaccharide biosynthesis/export family protein [Terriglobus roseus]|uniref:polysaccharide biosynthesis/export family protein n=1 Tax=Terriglobus roseus TaxID=392734 RepID=UPI001FE1BFC2|nr:polysaccharide biosynthesis/export family protein [Terriglobus roseus]